MLGAQYLTSAENGTPGPEGRRMTAAAGGTATVGFHLLDAAWTTADIIEKGIHPFNPADTGLVVMYLAPPGRNPKANNDWVGIYKQGQLNSSARIDWDYVCPNDEARCASFGAAVIPAGDNGMQSGQTYTVAYWEGGKTESNSAPLATLEYVVPW
ncbi:hypothetical protein ACFVVX_08555 [Kitasatospora sp. NPDC058170]|uniref:hypothetical protein n=1 Tax=Kitasatospora sp. NPDC058170 TaxID=3346364 RepID=UPI0036D9F341